jgi:hypothetical protein
MAQHPYQAKVTYRGARGALRGDILEDGVVIAHWRRQAVGRYVPPYEVTRWLSTQAKARWCGFCDSLSTEETIEAILAD